MKAKKKIAKLRVCASCEWVFKLEHSSTCPQCGFVTYGAYRVYGVTAYRYAESQKPWKNKKLAKYESHLNHQIKDGQCCWESKSSRGWHHHSKCKNFVQCK